MATVIGFIVIFLGLIVTPEMSFNAILTTEYFPVILANSIAAAIVTPILVFAWEPTAGAARPLTRHARPPEPMRAAFPYLGRGSWLARRDPRVLTPRRGPRSCIGVVQLRDARHLAVVLVLALGYYLTAGIPWQASARVQWAYLLVVIFIFSLFNTLISGGRTGNFADVDTHVLVTIPPFGAEISAEGISLMAEPDPALRVHRGGQLSRRLRDRTGRSWRGPAAARPRRSDRR